jgi:hypothetical protein
MYEPRVLHLGHDEAPYPEYGDSFPESWSASVCLADGRHLRVDWTADGVTSIGEDGRCGCADDWCPDLDQPRQYGSTLYGDGDSGERQVCFGAYHHRFVCNEFGMGWYPEGAPVPCDGSCRAPIGTLPKFVVEALRPYLEPAGAVGR